jgi:adenylate cyclase
VVDRGEDVVGHTVNLAARIAAMAGPGELLVTDDVVRACPSAAFRPIGPTRVRGVAEPVWVHRAWPV